MDAATTAAVGALLADPGATAAALPIVAKWDNNGTLKGEAEARAGAVAASSPMCPRAMRSGPRRRVA